MRFDRKKASRCKDCPYKDKKVVKGEGPKDAKVVLLGEAPGGQEEISERPFVGPAGRWLNAALAEAGLRRNEVYLTNVICCRPDGNNIHSFEATQAVGCCGLEEELGSLPEVKVVVPLGNTALEALGIDGTITKVRGSIYPRGKFVCVPTFHPSFIMRGQVKEEPTWIGDLEKALRLSKIKYRPPREKFNLFPTVGDVQEFAAEAKGKLIGVDIETTGLDAFNPLSRISLVGLSLDGERAIVVPFVCRDGSPYWSSEEEKEVRPVLNEVFKNCKLVFQNALFDVPFLRRNGYTVEEVEHDVLLIHHAYHPELPHNLGYIVSVYGDTPYWKQMKKTSDEEFRAYNARDAVVLHQVLPKMLKDLEDSGTEDTYYEVSRKMLFPVISMMENGIKLSSYRLGKWKKSLEAEIEEVKKKLYEVTGVCREFNFNSGDHLRLLVFGKKSRQFDVAKKALEEYEVNERKKKNTKRYRELSAVCKVSDTTVPLYQTSAAKQKTKGGSLSVDEKSLMAIEVAGRKRLAQLEELKRKKPKEQREVERLLGFLLLFRKYQEKTKLHSTYTSYNTNGNNRVHTHFLIHGTHSGRLASRQPNMQNIPEEARHIFVAEKGHTLIGADYTNLELVVLAYVSGDDVGIDAFLAGENFHDRNTKDMFGIDEKHKDWKTLRKAMKIYRFGRNYGGSLKGIYEKVLEAAPECGLTFAKFKEIDDLYRKSHPKYAQWFDRTTMKVKATRCLENAFGRKRYFLGTESEIVREGANFPIQSSAADIVNKAMIDIYSDPGFKGRILLQIHDELVFEVKKKDAPSMKKLIKKHMEQEFVINGYKVRFPIDIHEGSGWGALK